MISKRLSVKTMEVETSDKKIYKISEAVISHINLFKNILNCCDVITTVRIKVEHSIFDHILNFLKLNPRILNSGYENNDLRFKDEELDFLKALDINDLVKVSEASNYLESYYLLEISTFTISEYIKDIGVGDKKSLLFTNDLNDEDVKKIERTYEWIPDRSDD